MAQLLKNIYGHDVPLKKLLSAKKRERLPHALLFSGPSGIGKKKIAFALAQSLICPKPEEGKACGVCSSCIQVEKGKSLNMLFIQPDGLYIKVDSIRQILQFLSLQSFAPARVIIIDSAHLMNPQAVGSLLKILEEPPANVYFILVSSALSSLPVTIRSRTQTLCFSPLQIESLQKILKNLQEENNTADKDIAILDPKNQWMLKTLQGRLDNLEQWRENKELRIKAFDLLKQTARGEGICSFRDLSDMVKERSQALFVCLCWQEILRDACMLQLGQARAVIHQDQKELLEILKKYSLENLSLLFQKTISMEQDLKGYVDSLLVFDNFLSGWSY